MPAATTRSRSPRHAVAAAALAALALAGCSKGSDAGKTDVSKPTAVDRTTTTAAPTTTAVPTTTAPKLVGLPSPEDAARKLFDAWKAGDRTTAATIATPDAVTHMWAATPGDYYLYNHCDTAEFDTSGCLWRGNAGTIQFDLAKQGGVWIVADAVYSAP